MLWAERRRQRRTPRHQLRESDELACWLEECQVRGLKIVPGWLLARLVHLLSEADVSLVEAVGRQRQPLKLLDILFCGQEVFMERTRATSDSTASIVPIFR